MVTEVTSSVELIDPNSLSQDGYELVDQKIIPNEDIRSSFVPFQDLVEFWVYDANKNLLDGVYNFIDYILVPDPDSKLVSVNGEDQPSNTSKLELNPTQDTANLGYDVGEMNTVYNFITYKLGSTQETKYFISEISADRTELRLSTNFIENASMQAEYVDFKAEMDSNIYFDEFYLNFDNNQYQVCVNSQLDTSADQYTILIKLYEALPPKFSLKDELSVVVKAAESVAYKVTHPPLEALILSDVTFLKGPNTNLKINDFLNNSTELQSKDDLLNTASTASADSLSNVLNQKGIALTPNYSYDTFHEFINFSSAQRRIENFVEKVTQIQSYESDIATLNAITGLTSGSVQVSSSVATATLNIETLIKNFDGYEYSLYYSSGSSSYPKTGSYQPYELLPTTDVRVSVWLGSDVEDSQYYGGISLSASLFDNSNQNWLYYTIPEFIRDNGDNNQYLEFSNMVGQHFDEVWLYTKSITEKLNTTSQLTDGVPLDLADDVIASLGYDGFGSNFNNQDPYIGLIGENNGIYVPPTGSELITNYIAVNNGEVVNYWNPEYSFENYVEQLNNPGYPYAIDKVSKEIFKRLYHNMSYLVKKKGTISGLRQLINIWGIPNTILRINEFGGKNKDNIDDYDLWYNRYSYAFTPVSTQNVASASVVFPWMPLERNRIAEDKYIVPDNFQFRFKTTGYPSSSNSGEFFTQSLAVKKSDGSITSTEFDFGISLFYEPVVTGSYSGSHSSEYENWGKMRFYMSGSVANGGVATSNDIYLPFYDKGWWSIMLQRNQHVSASNNTEDTTYTLYAKNKINNGADGNSIGFEGSASIISNDSESINESWNKFGLDENDGIYLGGFVSGSIVGGVTTGLPGKIFSGSLQEFRYYSNDIPEATFNDFVMNPESIEGNNITGSESSFDIVNFRAPLGNELENVFTSSLSSSYSDELTSMHPAIQGTANILITGSFVNPTGNVTSSVYNILYYENSTTKTYSKTNTEVYFLDQPAIGFRNRISNKIQIRDGEDYGTILSNRISIQQDYQISQSYTENINNLEVAFSPQDEVNDDIIASFGYGVIADAIADPRFLSSSDDYYPQLRKIAEDYFKKYTEGNAYDYLRLIGYFDNSIFKAIKSYVPARTSVSTGIVIKQHMLERNRFPPVEISEGTIVAVTPSGSMNTPIIMENIIISGSIEVVNQETTVEGGTGNSLSKFNYVGNQFLKQSGSNQGNPASASFFEIPISQSWNDSIATIVGLETFVRDEQDEFYDGEFSGSELIVTTQSLFDNPFARTSNINISYKTEVNNIQSTLQPTNNHYTTPANFAKFANGHAYGSNSPVLIITGSAYNNSYTYESFQANAPTNIGNPTTATTFYNGGQAPIVVGLWRTGFSDDQTQGPAPTSVADTQNYYVSYIIIPEELDPRLGLSLLTSYLDNSVVFGDGGTTNSSHNPSPSGSYPYERYGYNDLAPYFRLELTSSFGEWDNGSSTKIDSEFGNLPYTTIDTSTMNNRASTVFDEIPSSGGVYLGKNGKKCRYQYFNNSSNYEESRPITFAPNLLGEEYKFPQLTASFIIAEPTQAGGYKSVYAIDESTPGTPVQYPSSQGDSGSFQWLITNFKTAQNSAFDNLTSDPVLISTASLYTFPVNFTNSFSGVTAATDDLFFNGGGQLIPTALSIHNRSRDPLDSTNINNNLPSFQLNPTIKFSLDHLSTIEPGKQSNFILTDQLISSSKPSTPTTSTNYLYNPIGSRVNYGKPNFSLRTTLASQYIINPYILDFKIPFFENSIYYATPNNFNANRPNTERYIVENQFGINTISNLKAIASGSAIKAQTPNSNYTAKKVILPRYLGTKITSANYNTFSPSGSTSQSFANGTTGSWGGDNVYGKTAAIDKNSIYFAHFQSSKENYELNGTYTFNIDQLIEVPFEDITENSLTIEPKTIKVDGSNNNLLTIANTFEKSRNVMVSYQSKYLPADFINIEESGGIYISQTGSSTIDYNTLTSEGNLIAQGGLEYSTLMTSQPTPITTLSSMSLQIGENIDIFFEGSGLSPSTGLINGKEAIGYSYSTPRNIPVTSGGVATYGSASWMITGSGYLQLEGPATLMSSSLVILNPADPVPPTTIQEQLYFGSLLSLAHSYNYWVKNQLPASSVSSGFNPIGVQPGIPTNSEIKPQIESNYFKFNVSSSKAGASTLGYTNFDLPFIIERGDEIRVTYNTAADSSAIQIFENQDFVVTDIPDRGFDLTNDIQFIQKDETIGAVSGIQSNRAFNRINVIPDPSTLPIKILGGKISNFTIRRRINTDDRVVVFQTPPLNSRGSQTPTKDGFLIPEDMTDIQKRNINTLINQLRSQNAVEPNSDST